MKKVLVFPILVAIASLVGCEQPARSGVSAASSDLTHTAYAMRGTDYSWPASASSNVVLASNKLAKNYYIVFDGSGSMSKANCEGPGAKIDMAKSAMAAFFNQLPQNVNVGLLVFDAGGAREVNPLTVIQPAALTRSINNVRADGNTPLGESMRIAYRELHSQAQRQLGYGEYNLVVITDGEASDPEQMEYVVEKITKESPVSLHTIGFCINGSHALNKKGVINYTSANNAEQLLQGLSGVLAESESFDVSSFKGA